MPTIQAPDREIRIRFSRLGAAILAAFHFVALVVPIALGLAWIQIGVLALLNALVLGYAWRSLREAARLSFRVPGEGVPEVRRANGEWQMIATSGDCRDSNWMITLVWRELASGRKARAAILRDACAEDDWRSLRIALRWGCLSPTRSSDAAQPASAHSPES